MPDHRIVRVAAALSGAALLLSPAVSAAASVDPSALVPALDLYVDAEAAGHAAASCAGPKSPAADEAGWQKAKAIFIATLWAADFPVNFVRTAQQRLDSSGPAKQPNCKDPALRGELGIPSQEGWVQAMQGPLRDMGLAVVTQPVTSANWATIKSTINKGVAAEKRLLDCLAVGLPSQLPGAVAFWEPTIEQIRERLFAAGLPRDEVAAELSAADANNIWHRTPPDAEAGLRDSCSKDQSWLKAGLAPLAVEIEKLLPTPPIAADDSRR